jgi:hypothetical protein
MKNFFFAVMLGVASFLSFTSCEKDEVQIVNSPPQIDILRQYATVGSSTVRFYYEVRILPKGNLVIPIQMNLDEISVNMSKVTDSIEKKLYLLETDGSSVAIVQAKDQGYFQLKSGKEYRMQIVVDAPIIQNCLYEVSVANLVYKQDLFKISQKQSFPGKSTRIDFYHM